MNNLKAYRLKLGLSQFGLARLSGVPSSTISRIEQHKIYPYPGWRRKLSAALNIDEAYLFPDEEVSADATPIDG